MLHNVKKTTQKSVIDVNFKNFTCVACVQNDILIKQQALADDFVTPVIHSRSKLLKVQSV